MYICVYAYICMCELQEIFMERDTPSQNEHHKDLNSIFNRFAYPEIKKKTCTKTQNETMEHFIVIWGWLQIPMESSSGLG